MATKCSDIIQMSEVVLLINKKSRTFCKIISVFDYMLALAVTLIIAVIVAIWFFIGFFFIFSSRTGIILTGGICLLSVALVAVLIGIILYGAVILWDSVDEEKSTYFLYQIACGVLTWIALVVGVALNITGAMSLLVSASYYIGLVGLLILNVIAFGVKSTEKNTLEKKTDMIKKEAFETNDSGKRSEEKKRQMNVNRKIGVRAIEGEYAGAVFLLEYDEKITFGTQPQCCQILFQDCHISRMHCTVCYRSDIEKYEIVDCSRNGTFWLNGERLPFGVPCNCSSGTIFTMNHQKQMFQFI